MKLQNVVQQDHKELITRFNAMFAYSKKQMSTVLKDYQSNVIKILAFHLSTMPTMSFMVYANSFFETNLKKEFENQREIAIKRIGPIWGDLRADSNLHGRLSSGFISRKTQPPWIPVKIDLQKPWKEPMVLPYSSMFYYFKKLEALIMEQVDLGLKHSESSNQIVKRVRNLFSTDKVKYKEAKDPRESQDTSNFDMNFTEDIWEKPPVEMNEGVFTQEDIDDLQARQKSAMGWYYTDYNPDMDEAIWARNKAFMGLEQDLMTDVVDMLHQGNIQIGSDNMGIEDFIWVTSKPQPKCDECCDRDGLTMTEIKEKIKDKYGDKPPRLHPHCRCQLVAQIKDDWTDSQLGRKGYEWDPDSGLAFEPSSQEKKLGFTSMNYDQWLGNLKDDYGSQNQRYL